MDSPFSMYIINDYGSFKAQIWKKKHCEKFDYSFIKNDYVCLYTLHLQKNIIFSLFKIGTFISPCIF